MTVKVKICGLNDGESLDAALDGGAAYVGFVFFEASPRHVDLATMAALATEVPEDVTRVVLLVDPDDATLDAVVSRVRVGMLQLHGKESSARVEAIRQAYGVPVMKAVGVATSADVEAAAAYDGVADQLLFDAKPPSGADRPGGHGKAYDWSLPGARSWAVPWMLAGGLTPDTVAEAIRRSGTLQVDVSSGVESLPGRKDPALIRAFLEAAHGSAASGNAC